jgi:hypothetical protein
MGENKIYLHETFSIAIIYPKESKKEFQTSSYSVLLSLFPEIPDFAKTNTHYFEDKTSKNFKIIQVYQPLKPGRFKLYPFSIKSGEVLLHSEGIMITVLPSEKAMKKEENIELEFEEGITDIMFRISSDRKEVFTGEAIEINASLLISEENTSRYNFINLFQQSNDIARYLSPANSFLDEFSSGLLDPPVKDTITIRGIVYTRIKFYEGKFYPLVEGKITFDPYTFHLLKYSIAKIPQMVIWKSDTLSLASKPLQISIKALPPHPLKNRVPVGKFSLKEGVSHNKIKTGKHFIYRAIITGEGNFATIVPPELKENESLDFYSPVLKQRVIRESKNAGGKILEFTIIPKEPGTYHLADYFKWVYFNPSEKRYDSLTSKLTVYVEGESQKDKEISTMDLGSFYELVNNESNKLRSMEKDESIKFFANIIILFMLAITAILVLKR